MKNLAKLFTSLSFCLISFTQVQAQSQPLMYSNGMPIKELEYTDIQGSPYLFDEWHTGSVALNSGKLFDNLQLKYNIKDDVIYFKNNDDSPMAFKDAVRSFTLMDNNNKAHIFRNGYTNATGITDKSYLEVMAPGKTQFLKKDSKSISESKEYGSTAVSRRFMEGAKYYIYIGTTDDDSGKGKMVLVKKDQKSILGALYDKADELADYVQKNGLNLKNEQDIVILVTHYNTLIK